MRTTDDQWHLYSGLYQLFTNFFEAMIPTIFNVKNTLCFISNSVIHHHMYCIMKMNALVLTVWAQKVAIFANWKEVIDHHLNNATETDGGKGRFTGKNWVEHECSKTCLSPNAIYVHLDHVFATWIVYWFATFILRIYNAAKRLSGVWRQQICTTSSQMAQHLLCNK